MPTVSADTWGGRIIVRPDGLSFALDRAEVLAAGFTVLGTDYSAGEAVLWVYSSFLPMDNWINDYDRKNRLPGQFIPLGYSHQGEEITLVLIKQWVSDGQIAF